MPTKYRRALRANTKPWLSEGAKAFLSVLIGITVIVSVYVYFDIPVQ